MLENFNKISRVLFVALLSFLAMGCTSPMIGSGSAGDSCLDKSYIISYSSVHLCKLIWTKTNDRSCYIPMIEEIERRGQLHVPEGKCGLPLPSVNSCNWGFSYRSKDSKYLCNTYWRNEDLKCDAVILSELEARQEIADPYEKCGESKNAKVLKKLQPDNSPKTEQCPITFTYFSTNDLCEAYRTNPNRLCEVQMWNEIRRRGVKTDGLGCYSPEPVSKKQLINASTDNICKDNSFAKYSAKDLCRAYWSNNSRPCDPAIANEMSKRGIDIYGENCKRDSATAPSSHATEEPKASVPSSCVKIINEIKSSPAPITAACDFRYKSAVKESITCRKYVNEYIASKSLGVGTNSLNCGKSK